MSSTRPFGPLQAVLFDLDGTLVDTERESADAMARALEIGQGVVVDQTDKDGIIGRSWVEIYRNLRARYSAISWSLDQLIAETAAIRHEILEESGLEPLPGVRSALERFASLPMAVVTGSSRVEAEHALEILGVRSRFRALFAAEDVASSKPDPAGYLAAADALGAPPSTCLVIEDSTAGIAAGRAAGAWVVAVRAGNFADQDQSQAHQIVDTLDDLTAPLIDLLVRGRDRD